jgi:multidrug resistance protein, MATE family
MLQAAARWWNRLDGGRAVAALAWPLVVSTSSWTLMYFIDRVFLTWHSPAASAASTTAGQVMWLALAVFLGVASYANTFVAQYHGAGREGQILAVVRSGALIGVACQPLLWILIPAAPWFFGLWGHPQAVLEQEVLYFQIMASLGAAQVVGAAQSAYFTGRGRVAVVMWVDLAAALCNILLDYAWIFGRLGFPAWGIAGAAWATVAAHCLKVALLAWLIYCAEGTPWRASLRAWRLDWDALTRLLRFGLPAGLQLALEMAGFTALVMLIGMLGEAELAATTVAFSVNSLAFLPMLGLGSAVTTLVGQRLGQNLPRCAARATWTAFWIGTTYMTAWAVVYATLPDFLLAAHGAQATAANYPEVRRIASELLVFVALYSLFDTMNIVFSSAIKGAGDTRFVAFTTLFMSTIHVFAAWYGVRTWGWEIRGVWTVATVWIIAQGLIYWARFGQGKWRTMRVIGPDLPGALGRRRAELQLGSETA